MRMRVEELAKPAEVSVDTVRYYQKQHLLPPPERDGRLALYTDEHLERMRRIKDLQRRGFTLAVIRRFLAGELDPADEGLAAAVAEAGDGEADGEAEELFDIDELAARTRVPGADARRPGAGRAARPVASTKGRCGSPPPTWPS